MAMADMVREPVAPGEAQKRKRCEDDDEENKDQKRSEDWCFICKNGGDLYLCDHPECGKAYHARCLKQKKLSFPSRELPWHCSRHTCSKCQDPSKFFCYCCPKALCHNCMYRKKIQFLPIKTQYGFCPRCWKGVQFLEDEVELRQLSRSKRLFKEYYEMVKMNEGLKNLHSPEDPEVPPDIKGKNKSSACDVLCSLEEEKNIIELKSFSGQQNRRFNSGGKYQDEEVGYQKPEVCFASLVSDNIKLVYLKRSLVLELLKEPESFGSKVKGSYVRVADGHQSNSYKLVQVTGVKKALNGQDTDLKLQLLDMPNDMSIDLLSDANFTETECEDLRQRMKFGQLKKPTFDDLEEKARSLHEDMIDHRLACEKRQLEGKIAYANERGKRSMLYQLLEERKLIESPSYRLQLLNTPLQVIPELPATSNQLEGPPFLIDATMDCAVQPVDVTVDCAVQPVDATMNRSVKPNSLSCERTFGAGEQSPSDHGGVTPRYPIRNSAASSIGDEDLRKLLDQLVKPDTSCSSTDDASFEAVKYLQEGLILSLKKVPISDFKSMLSMANGVFTCLNVLSTNYSSLYERIKNYIHHASLLASTEEFKKAASVEELAAQYESGKDYDAVMCKRMKKLSASISDVFQKLEEQINEEESFSAKFGSENLACGKEHQSLTLREVSEKLKKTRDEIRRVLEYPDKSKVQCYFAEIWEAFLRAKAALGL